MVYIIAAAAAFIPAVFTIVRRRDAALLSTYVVAGAIVITAEYVAIGLLELYRYKPGLLADPLSDTASGIILAELFLVPSLAVLGEGYLPGWRGLMASTALVTWLEWLFLRWGIYENRGWNLWYTLILFPLYFSGVHLFWKHARQSGLRSGLLRVAARAGLITWCFHIFGVTVAWLIRPLVWHIHLLPTFARNQALGWGLTGWLPSALLCYWVLVAPGGRRWASSRTATPGIR